MASIASSARASLKVTSRPQRRNVVTVKATYMEFSNQAANSSRVVQAQSGHVAAPLQLQVQPKEETSLGIVQWIAQIIAGPAPAEREPWMDAIGYVEEPTKHKKGGHMYHSHIAESLASRE